MQVRSAENDARRTAIIAVIFFAAALAVRLVYLYHFSTSPFFDPKATGLDPLAYDEMARGIAAGDVIGTGIFEIMPFYGYVLGALYAVFGHGLYLAYAFQALISASAVVLLYLFVRRFMGGRVAIVAGVGGIICQSLVFHVGMLTGETLAVFLTVAMLYALSVATETDRLSYFLTAGFVAGFGVITRGTFAIFVVLFAVWYVIVEHRRWRRALPRAALFVLGTVLVIVPITLKNAVAGGDFVMVTAHGGVNYYIGNNPGARGGFQPVPELGVRQSDIVDNARDIAERAEGHQLKPSEISRYWKNRALQFVRENPKQFLRLTGEKILAFFNVYEISDVISLETMKRFSSLLRHGLLPYGFITPFAILGMILSIRRRVFAPMYLFIIANLIAVIVTFVNARYRLAVLPLFLIFSGVSLVWLKDNMRYRWRLAAGIVAIVLSFLAVYKPLVAGEEPAVNAYNLANAYQYMGKGSLAEQEYKRALELKPSYADARYGLGMLYWDERRIDAARKEFLEILKMKPDDVDALNQLGNMSLYSGDRKAALDYWQRSLAIDEDQPEVKEAIEKNKL